MDKAGQRNYVRSHSIGDPLLLLSGIRATASAGHRGEGCIPATAERPRPFLGASGIGKSEIREFERLLAGDITSLPDYDIESGVYVLHTFEASIRCLFTTESYRDAVPMAVNLGNIQ
ncbi:MAG: hypothetical protein KFH87_03690 [Bacteroidetes bacterium]|nr:hypothetical protein [Bacteroidota bacterium]